MLKEAGRALEGTGRVRGKRERAIKGAKMVTFSNGFKSSFYHYSERVVNGFRTHFERILNAF